MIIKISMTLLQRKKYYTYEYNVWNWYSDMFWIILQAMSPIYHQDTLKSKFVVNANKLTSTPCFFFKAGWISWLEIFSIIVSSNPNPSSGGFVSPEDTVSFWPVYEPSDRSYIRFMATTGDYPIGTHFRRREVSFWSEVAPAIIEAVKTPGKGQCGYTNGASGITAFKFSVMIVATVIQFWV